MDTGFPTTLAKYFAMFFKSVMSFYVLINLYSDLFHHRRQADLLPPQ